MLRGAEFSRAELLGELWATDLPSLGLSFPVPMFFFHGTCDQQTPIELAERRASWRPTRSSSASTAAITSS
jgi:hypothetical protein